MQGNGRNSRGKGQGRDMRPGRRASSCRFEEQGSKRPMSGRRFNGAQPNRPYSARQDMDRPWQNCSPVDKELAAQIGENRKLLDTILEKIDSLLCTRA